jgi:tetratricopeptide (TPR) repeat protein/DNA-binding CsgD family transcriptional regulator
MQSFIQNKAFYTLLFFFLFQFVFAQSNQNIDSLKTVLNEQSGNEKIQTLDYLFDYYYLKDLDSAKKYAEIMLKESQKSQESNRAEKIAKAYNNLGIFHTKKSDLNNAKKYLLMAINIEKKNSLQKQLASSYRIIAGLYNNKGDLQKSTAYMYKALHIYDSIKDFGGIASCYNNIGILHKQNHDYNKAVNSYLKGLEIIKQNKVKDDKVSFYSNLSVAYRYLKQYDSSFYYLRQAISTSKKNLNYSDLADSYLMMSKLLMDQNIQNDSIGYYLDQSFIYAKKTNNTDINTILTTKGKWYYLRKEYTKAIVELEKGLAYSQKHHNLIGEQYALYYLYKIRQKTGDYQQAIKDLEYFVDVQDSINFSEAQVKINQLQEKFENKKKQIKIKQLEKIKRLDNKIKWMLYIIILGILSVSVYTIRNLLRQRKRNKLEKEEIEKDLKQKNKQLTSQALMMMQKNTLLNDILLSLQEVKNVGLHTQKDINELKRKLRRSMHSEDDWELFKQYFEMVNKDFFIKLKNINQKLTPAELKLCALTKLRFSIKETATLINISPDSVKSSRSTLRRKLGLKRQDNLYDFLNGI